VSAEWGGLDAIFTPTPTPDPPPPPARTHLTLAATPGTTPYGRKALAANCAAIANPQPKTRNRTLNDHAFATYQLVEAGLIDRADADRELWSAARAASGKGDHPFPDSEIAATLRSAATGAKAKPRLKLPDLTRPYNPLDWITAQPTADPAATDAFWDARPHHALIRQWAQARRASPWAVLGCVLARTTTLIPPFHILPPLTGGQASLNLFIGLVGPSGSGKGAADAVARELLDTPPITQAPLGSGEGIAHQYMRRLTAKEGGGTEMHTREVLFTLNEIDTLAALHGRQGSTVLAELRRAWMGEQLGFAYVDPAKRLPVDPHTYRFTLIAGIQPGRAAILLDDADGGTPQRFTWLPATDPDAPEKAPPPPKRITWEPPRTPFKAGQYGGSEMGVCAAAAETIDSNRYARLKGDGHALDGHGLLARLKIAAALTWLDNRHDIEDADWQLAGTVMQISDDTRASCVTTLHQAARASSIGRAEGEAERQIIISERVDDAAAKRVARAITRALRHAGPDGLTRSAARKAVTSRDRGHFDDAIHRLAEAGRIHLDTAFDGDRITLLEDQ